MATFNSCAIITFAVFAIGVFQTDTLPTKPRDDIYNQFAAMIEFQEQLAQAKLNFVIGMLVNELASSPTDPTIQTNLSQCFESAVEQNPTADPVCLQDVLGNVNQTIYDSQQQLGFCANLTHGWLVAEGQLPVAYKANETLVNIVNEILTQAQQCVRRFGKNPSKEYTCMLKVEQQYSDQWQNATVAINLAYNELSGVSLLVGLNIHDCLSLEEDTLQDKCTGITADVVSCTQNATRHHFQSRHTF